MRENEEPWGTEFRGHRTAENKIKVRTFPQNLCVVRYFFI